MRRKAVRTLAIGASAIGVASLSMAVSGEFEAILAWWMAIVLLLPPLLWSLKTRYVALKTICLLAFFTQFVTVPFFYFARDTFAWSHVKPFGFTAVEAWPMLSKVMLFVVCLIIFFKLLYRLRLFDESDKSHSGRFQLPAVQLQARSFLAEKSHYLNPSRHSWIYGGLIFLVISMVAPLNLWMYSQGISMVGVEPPRLPYRLSGILHYLTVFVIPLLIGLLYWKSKRSFFLIFILLCYAWVLGLTSLSRSALITVMLPVLAFAWLDRRRWHLMVAGLGTVVGYAVVSSARSFVYIITAGKAGADTGSGILAIIADVFTEPDAPLLEADFLLKTFVGIFSRMDGFKNLVMAEFYDPYAVGGPLRFLLRMIWRPFAYIDPDLHHMQWQGNVPPEGFYGGGALFSNAVILGNASLLWVIASALVAAGILVFLEKSAHRVIARYGLPDLLASAIIGFLTSIFFIERGGAVSFTAPLLLLSIASLLPPFYRFNRQNSSVAIAHSTHGGHRF